MASDHRDDAPVAEIGEPAHERRQGPVLAVMPGDLRSQLRRRPGAELDLRYTRGGVLREEQASQLHQAGRLDRPPRVGFPEVVLLRGQRELSLGPGPGEGGFQLGPEIAPLPFQLEGIVEHPDRTLRQVVGHRLQAARKEARKDGGEAGREQRVVL